MPIIDTHCDLLFYLLKPDARIDDKEIGCSLPFLKSGNVKLQVMAMFAPTTEGSHQLGLQQSQIFNSLINQENDFYLFQKEHLDDFEKNEKIGIIASIENASAFCDENMPLKDGFKQLETIIENVEQLFYIGMTHHTENRFGGGNYSKPGLKKDGEALLDYINGRNIAIDFSHTSDALAYDILNYTTKNNLDIPIIASHSNYRPIFDHPRNLPDEIAQEIIHRQGLIGVNFLRAFVHPKHPEVLFEHIAHGLELGGKDVICYGADFFYTKTHPDQSRVPFFFPEHEDASVYPVLNETIKSQFGVEFCEKLSYQNAVRFFKKLWG